MLLEFKIRSCEESSPAASSQLGGCVMTGLLLVAAIVNAKKPLFDVYNKAYFQSMNKIWKTAKYDLKKRIQYAFGIQKMLLKKTHNVFSLKIFFWTPMVKINDFCRKIHTFEV